MTGREAAMRILHQAGIYDVTVRHVSGKLTDHYDPRTKTVNLSDAVYDSTSVAAIGVAAHECGHAVQHNTDYVPLKVRSAIVPAANLGSQQISVSSSPAVFVKDTVSPSIWNESAVTSSFEKSTTFSASAPESELPLSASAVLFFFVSTASTARSSTKRIRQAARLRPHPPVRKGLNQE